MSLPIAVIGAAGRLGQLVVAAAPREGVEVVGAVARAGSEAARAGALTAPPASARVLIDVSAPEALAQTLAWGVDAGRALVLCTTGLSEAQHRAIDDAAQRVPVVQSYNMSLGVNLLLGLVERAARALGPGFDIEIVEAHHRLKKDAPSGTALALAASAARGRDLALEEAARHGRQGLVGARGAGEIGLHAVRGGTVVGDHQVLLLGDGERVSFSHLAEDRGVFARGALRAAVWAAAQPPGRYTMRDVLGVG